MIENLTLAIRGKCEIKEAFQETNEKVKEFGKSNKDAAEAGKKAFSEMSAVVDNQVTASFGKAFSIVTEMAKGGIWAAMAEAVKFAVGFISEKLKEMEQHAIDVSKAITNGISGAVKDATEKFNAMASAADNAMKVAGAVAANKNSIIDSEKEYQIQKLRYEAYQKCLEEATEEGRLLIEAEMNMRISYVELNAQTDKAKNQVEAQTKILEETTKKREAAEDAVCAALNAQKDANNELNRVDEEKRQLINRYMTLQEQQNTSVEALCDQGMQYVEAMKFKKESADEYVKFEKENADLLKQYGDLIKVKQESGKRVKEAEDRLGSIKLEEEKASVDLKNAKMKLETVTLQNKAATEKASQAISDLERASIENAQAEINAANVQNQITNAKIQAEQAKEAADIKLWAATVAAADWLSSENKVTDMFVKNKIKRVEAEKVMIEVLKTAQSTEEVYTEVKKAIAEILGKRKKQEEEELLWDEKRFEEKKKDPAKVKSEASESATLTVRVPDLAQTANNQYKTFKEYEKEQRMKAREERDARSEFKKNQAQMTTYLKGGMNTDRAKAFANYFKDCNDPLNAMETAFESSLKSQLLNETQIKEQTKRFQELVEYTKKIGGLK